MNHDSRFVTLIFLLLSLLTFPVLALDTDGDGIADSLDPFPADNTQPDLVVYTLQGAESSAKFGWSVRAVGDIDKDGYTDFIAGAPEEDAAGKLNAGRVRAFSGYDGSELFAFDGGAYEEMGRAIGDAGDVNADGYHDIIIGTSSSDELFTNGGKIQVFSGKNGELFYEILGEGYNDLFGYAVSGAGDVNGDGFDDFMASSPYDGNLIFEGGSVSVFSGADGSRLHIFDGTAQGDLFGYSIAAAGDVNADGYDDVIVGTRFDDLNGNNSGSARVFSGVDGSLLYLFNGDFADDRLGQSVSGAGDINNDGYDDVIVGSANNDNQGSNSGFARIYSGVDGSILYTLEGNAGDAQGVAVAAAGDVNFDGYPDVVVGAVGANDGNSDTGAVRVYSGSDGELLYEFFGDTNGNLGSTVAGLSRINDLSFGVAAGDSAAVEGIVRVFKLEIDTDADGMHDAWEAANGLNTNNPADAAANNDGDGLTNLQEFIARTDPAVADTDGDGFDDDVDTVPLDASENADADADGLGDNADLDDDNDGMPDSWELSYGLNPNLDDSAGDGDSDTLTNLQEYKLNSNPLLMDTDSDGVDDNLDVFPADGTETVDFDGDGIGDNADFDDDNDSIADVVDVYPFDDTLPDLQQYDVYGADNAESFGFSVSGLGDVNGDGYADYVVGAPSDKDEFDETTGSARVISGLDGTELFKFYGNDPGENFGQSVGGAGDVNNDGYMDIIVGAYRDDEAGNDRGSARVYSGIDGAVLYTFYGAADNDELGYSVDGAGDVNADGYADVVISARDDAVGDDGAAIVYSGIDGAVLHKFLGNYGSDFWKSVSGAGDVNGDGYADIIVGAYAEDNNGESSGAARVFSGADGAVLYTFNGTNSMDRFGVSVSGAGDVNNDGYADVIVGANGYDHYGFESDSGMARIYSGIDGGILYTFYGADYNDEFGVSVAGLGDVDKDGYDDVIVGAAFAGTPTNEMGMARVFSGANGSILYDFKGDADDDRFGYAVSGAGGDSVDGFARIIVGAFNSDINAVNGGLARIYRLLLDSDLDGMDDGWEIAFGLDPQDDSDASLDGDSDNLTNVQEYNLGTNPLQTDSDGDGIDDGVEDANLNGVVDNGETNPAKSDSDDDGLSDSAEINTHLTAPLLADSDGDSILDGVEVNNGRDPLSPDYHISAGDYHNCVIDDAGVTCWGNNGSGQTTAPSLTNPVDISAGANHTCAIDDAGVVCWGSNASGQSTVPSLTNPVQVAAGTAHTCALDDSGVTCWGDNFFGQRNVPALVNPIQISSGDHHNCALDDNGVACWGYNADGQTTVPSLSNPIMISAGRRFTCALDDTGVVCWGKNEFGQTDVPVLNSPSDVAVGGYHSCAIDSDIICWGANGSLQSTPPSVSAAGALDMGEFHSCALHASGVSCWGSDTQGQVTVPSLFFDADNDGLSNSAEDVNQNGVVDTGETDPANSDTDGDGVDDGTEIANGTDPTVYNKFFGVRSDVDADNDDDLVFQNGVGSVTVWFMQDANRQSSAWLGDLSTAAIVAYADVDNDNDADLLFQNAGTSDVTLWTMQNGSRESTTWLGAQSGYTLSFSGDLDSDADADLVFGDASGNIIIWVMESGAKQSASWLGQWSGQSVMAMVDIDGDGDDDIVTQDSGGNVNVVEMENATKVAARWLGVWSGRNVVGAGDADNDGDEDIYMETISPSGDVMVIEMENGLKVTGRWLGIWSGTEVLAVGDIDSDGDADLIQQNSGSGSVQVVEIENGAKVTGRWLGTFAYDVKGVVDADADGDVDVALQDGSGNVALIELENGSKLGGAKWLGVNTGELVLPD